VRGRRIYTHAAARSTTRPTWNLDIPSYATISSFGNSVTFETQRSDRTSRWPLRAPLSTCRSGTRTISWSFQHFGTITVSVADAPRPDEILVVIAIADGGRLRNRCGTEPIR
jgi:hypothetical protein